VREEEGDIENNNITLLFAIQFSSSFALSLVK